MTDGSQDNPFNLPAQDRDFPFCLRCECMTTLGLTGLVCPCVQRGKLPKLVNSASDEKPEEE